MGGRKPRQDRLYGPSVPRLPRQLITRHTPVETQGQRRGRILLAEDNVVNQKVALGLLKKLGYGADVVSNGREAAEAVARQPYDLVLMDCQMPELDGFAATVQIRQHEGDQRHILIVAMTASAMQGDRERCLAAGMDDYVTKPITLDVLREKLTCWLPGAPAITSDVAGTLGHAETPWLHDPLDRKVVETLRELLEEAFPEVMEAFRGDTSTRLEALREASARHDLPTVSYIAHTLKGSSGNLGATHFSALCQQLLCVSEAGLLAETTRQVGHMEAEFLRVCTALAQMCRVPAVETAATSVQ